MTADKLPDDYTLSDVQFRKVIELAAVVPARGEGITVAQLRQIAADLDINPEALARALDVVLAESLEPRQVGGWWSRMALRVGRATDRILPSRWRPVILGGLAGVFGWLDAFVSLGMLEVINGMTIMTGSTSTLIMTITGLLAIFTLLNSLSRRRTGRLRRYLAESALTWGSLGLAWSITWGSPTMDLLTFIASALGLSALWGWLIIRPAGRAGHPVAGAATAEANRTLPSSDTTDPNRLARVWLVLATRGTAT